MMAKQKRTKRIKLGLFGCPESCRPEEYSQDFRDWLFANGTEVQQKVYLMWVACKRSQQEQLEFLQRLVGEPSGAFHAAMRMIVNGQQAGIDKFDQVDLEKFAADLDAFLARDDKALAS